MRAAPSHSDIPTGPATGPTAGSCDLTELISISPAIRQSIRVLVIDDERSLRESCATTLGVEGYHVTTSGRAQEALEILKRRAFDIVLIDLYMADVPGIELLRTALATHRDTIVIVITGRPSLESSLEVLQAGAWDYLPKPFTGTQLQILIGRAAHSVVVARESRAREQLPQSPAANSDRLTVLGTAPLFRQAIELARKVASTDASVFITGESGAGKELIAQFIHAHSRRHARPIVAVNCAALPESLSSRRCSGTSRAPSPGPSVTRPGCSRRRTAARCSSTNSWR